MIKEKVLSALNKQLNEEFYSSYVYLAMAAYFENTSLTGFAHWMKVQSREEYDHAIKIYDFIHRVNGKVHLKKIDSPKVEWKSPMDVVKEMYEHEKKVTESINEIVDLSVEEKDHATTIFMQWFVNEQIEEEDTALRLLDKLKMVGDNKNGLYILDRELAARAAE
ncbi:MAG: ferritin [Ignavibacteriaceae bacterium]